MIVDLLNVDEVTGFCLACDSENIHKVKDGVIDCADCGARMKFGVWISGDTALLASLLD